MPKCPVCKKNISVVNYPAHRRAHAEKTAAEKSGSIATVVLEINVDGTKRTLLNNEITEWFAKHYRSDLISQGIPFENIEATLFVKHK